ncbi:hypothetical protein ABZ464_50220 [Streptomyces sp. NPDC005820]|uniref:hypothetical protein n=1 Tax=Streptomyces sp. NPDC005820 TaxID=3157069 RepID=UPI0033FB396E
MSTTTRPDPLATFESLDPAVYAFTRRAWGDAPPARVYQLVGDVSSISRWSPNATDAAYDHDAGPRVGAWFSGRNRKDGRDGPPAPKSYEPTPRPRSGSSSAAPRTASCSGVGPSTPKAAARSSGSPGNSCASTGSVR